MALLAVTGAATSVAAPAASAETREFWVAAVPAPTWNMSPNERDAIHGMPLSPSQTVFPTVVYRRYSAHWHHPMRNVAAGTSNQDLIPGPLLRARAGDRLLVHFKNMDTLYKRPHSMHFHGVHYRPSSDGAYVPGFSGRDGDVKPGQTWTLDDGTKLEFVGTRPFATLAVRHDPTQPLVLGGAVLGLLGLMLSLAGHRRRLWFRIAPRAGSGSLMEAGGLPRTDYPGFDEEFGQVVAAARGSEEGTP